MNTLQRIVAIAAQVHRQCWSQGFNVSEQTKKSQVTCKQWQVLVLDEFGQRFTKEKPIGGIGTGQKIDLVDENDRVAYELKASKNNVHMEIYRDVFKILVFNQRNPTNRIRTLVFIAPKLGIENLGKEFPNDVQAIVKRLKLDLILEGI